MGKKEAKAPPDDVPGVKKSTQHTFDRRDYGPKLKTNPTLDTEKITAELVQLNAEFFTHAKPEDALVKIVLSGLPVFEGSVKLTQLREVKTIYNVVVWWRFYTRNKTDVMQCFRCQGFGHGSRYCNMRPRCVQSGQKHGSNECQLPTKAELEKAPDDVRQKIRCANCNLNHTANFKACTARKDYLKHQEKKKPRKASPQAEKASPSPRKFTSNVVAPGLSFANIAAGPGTGSPPGAAPNDDLFSITEFLGGGEMYARLSKCTTREEQFFALHELMVKYIYVH
ncbi:hypothetical protein quinque_010551 [Culex quinquefasciatus]